MRKQMTGSMFAWSGMSTLALVVAVMCLAGCSTDFPVVSQTGDVGGGDPKLDSLLNIAKDMRDGNALDDAQVIEAVYVAAVQPSGNYPVSYEAIFPATDRAVKASCHLMCSSETLEKSSDATVTEFLVIRRNGSVRTTTRSLLLTWHKDKWEECSLTGVTAKPQ